MGNCLDSCFGKARKRSNHYFFGRYKDYDVGIEFESLIEDDSAQQSNSALVTEQERDHLLNKRYSALIQDQKRRDIEIEAELQRQEDNVRLEEEAYITAKRESARAARQAKTLQQKRGQGLSNGKAQSSWLGDNESEWNVAGGDDDFELFLESVKARSQSVRANGIAPSTNISSSSSLPSPKTIIESGLSPNQEETSSKDSDSEWKPDFVGSFDPPELQSQTLESKPTPDELAKQTEPNLETVSIPAAINTNPDHILRRETRESNMITGLTKAEDKQLNIDVQLDGIRAAAAGDSVTILPHGETDGFASSKLTTADDDPFDFDKFLEELDLEG